LTFTLIKKPRKEFRNMKIGMMKMRKDLRKMMKSREMKSMC
jgi:hypothetical protein